MNCKNCGEKLSAFSAYCEKCGQKAFSTKEWLAYYGNLLLSFLKKRLWLSISVAVAIVLVVVGGIILNTSKQLNPMDYVVVDTRGYSGAGRLSLSIDTQSLADKLLGPVPDKTTAKGYEQHAEYTKQLKRLEQALFVSSDVYGGLSNDDFFIVTVTITDAELFKELGAKLKDTVYTKTLQIGKDCDSFEVPVEFNIFDHIAVEFNGDNGNGYVVISDDKIYAPITFNPERTTQLEILCYENWFGGGYTCSIYFEDTRSSASITLSLENASKLSNGSTATISISESDIKTLVEQGVLITPSSKTYQVTGLS